MNMKKWIAAALACSALALSACGGQSKDASSSAPKADKVYRVAANAEFAPFESLDSAGNVEGFDVDLMNAMAKAGEFKVEFKHQPWDSLFPALKNGDTDIVISGVTITDERKQSMDFTDPYFEITQVVLVPKGKKVASSDDLSYCLRTLKQIIWLLQVGWRLPLYRLLWRSIWRGFCRIRRCRVLFSALRSAF